MIAAVLLVAGAPAVAAGGTSVPEPSNWALFALGVTGVLVGRFGLGRRRKRPEDRSDAD